MKHLFWGDSRNGGNVTQERNYYHAINLNRHDILKLYCVSIFNLKKMVPKPGTFIYWLLFRSYQSIQLFCVSNSNNNSLVLINLLN